MGNRQNRALEKKQEAKICKYEGFSSKCCCADLLGLIFMILSMREVVCGERVCRAWQKHLSSDSANLVWRRLYISTWPKTEFSRCALIRGPPWRDRVKNRLRLEINFHNADEYYRTNGTDGESQNRNPHAKNSWKRSSRGRGIIVTDGAGAGEDSVRACLAGMFAAGGYSLPDLGVALWRRGRDG